MSENSHYIVDLSRLPIGAHQFDFTLDNAFFSALEKTDVLGGEVAVHAALNLHEEDFTLDLAVHGAVSVVCDRCLDPMTLDIDDNQILDASDVEEDSSSLPFMGEELCSIERPVDGRRTLSGLGSLLDLSWLAYEIVSVNIPLVHSHQPGACNPQMDLLLHQHLCDLPDPDIDQ